jgi:dTDP-4-dehydrorhamnose 3,5-epimerase
VAVDIRRESPTFGKWVSAELSEENRAQLWIPEGFAHGFLALREGTEFLYKATNLYDSALERGIAWNDPAIAVDWKSVHPTVSERDRRWSAFDR